MDDAALHQLALQAGPDADCRAIRSPDLRADCASWRAGALASSGQLEEAEEICEDIKVDAWKGECWFLVADFSSASIEEAAVLCQRAAPYEDQCIDHAILRLAEQLTQTSGAEMEAVEVLTELWIPLFGPGGGSVRARATVADLIGQRPLPLTRASFGNADKELIITALTHHLTLSRCSTKDLSPDLESEISKALLRARRGRRCRGPRSGPNHAPG